MYPHGKLYVSREGNRVINYKQINFSTGFLFLFLIFNFDKKKRCKAEYIIILFSKKRNTARYT